MYLRRMHMHVVHGGNEQAVAEIHELCIIIASPWSFCHHLYHAPVVIHGDIAVFQHLKTVFLFCIEDMSLIYFLHITK